MFLSNMPDTTTINVMLVPIILLLQLLLGVIIPVTTEVNVMKVSEWVEFYVPPDT